jgi:predicted transcriptional regulator
MSKDIGDFRASEIEQMRLNSILDLHEALDIMHEQKQYEQQRLEAKYGHR